MKKLIPLLLLLLLFAGCLGDKIKYEVNSSKCNGCNKCVVQCPVNAITVINGKAYIDASECVGCGICVDICPRDAIK
jgi:ferredoxin